MCEVSIIIPSHNDENYIKRCLKSISDQIFTDFEVIIVDSSFLDNTRTIIREYIKDDNRFSLIELEKGLYNSRSVSLKRNIGIDKAKGEYILFVDADDYIDEKLLEDVLAYTKENDLDICHFDFIMVDDKENIIKECVGGFTREIISYNKDNYIYNLLNYMVNKKGVNYAWNKLFKESIIKEHNLRFKEDLYMSEDIMFNYEILKSANKVGVLDKSYYYYVKRKNTMTSSTKNLDDVLPSYYKIYNNMKEVVKVEDNENIEISNFLFVKLMMIAMYFIKIKTNNDYNAVEKVFDDFFIENNIFSSISLEDFENAIDKYFEIVDKPRYSKEDYYSFIDTLITRNGAIAKRQEKFDNYVVSK